MRSTRTLFNPILDYHHWFALITGLLCLLFYIPQMFWKSIVNSNSSNYATISINKLNAELYTTASESDQNLKLLAQSLDEEFHFERKNLYTWQKYLGRLVGYLPFCQAAGTRLCFFYIVMKVAYICIPFINLYVLKNLIAFKNHTIFEFYFTIVSKVWDFTKFYATNYFPLNTLCKLNDFRGIGNIKNSHAASCGHSDNLYNKYFMAFLTIWSVVLTTISIVGLFIFVFRNIFYSSRQRFIKNLLRKNDVDTEEMANNIEGFVKDYLKIDGVFIISTIKRDFGDVIASTLTFNIYQIYLNRK